MPLIRTKNNIPQNYVSESRDFQLFTRVLDFTQNSIKFDIDAILNIIETDLIPQEYLDRLKSKLGFFTLNNYDEYTMRKILSAFPHIIKYKGSEEGIERCVNVFLNIIGVRDGCKIDIYNTTNDKNDYTIRIGIKTHITDTNILKDMLSYILPPGYFVETYFYTDTKADPGEYIFNSIEEYFGSDRANDVRVKSIEKTESAKKKNDAYNTVQLSTIYDPKE